MRYNKEKYFSCYSPNLKEFLEMNGFEYIKTFKHYKTEKNCWVFDKTLELSEYLIKWKENKDKRE